MLTQNKRLGPQSTKNYLSENMPQMYREDQYLKKSPQIKNQKYYADTVNIWNNSSRLSTYNQKFLNIDKTDQAKKRIEEGVIQDRQQQELVKSKRVLSAKHESRQQFQQRQYQEAVIQKECRQVIDDKQNNILQEAEPNIDFQEIRRQLWRPQTSQKINQKFPEAGWNKVDDISSKNAKIVFNGLVVKNEEKCIQNTKNKIREEKEIENKKKQYFQQKHSQIRNQFLKQHKNNIEKEKQLKLGVFGKWKKNEFGKFDVTAVSPKSAKKEFPLKYDFQKDDSYANINVCGQNNKQMYERLAQPKKAYQPEDTFEYQDFRGLFVADCDQKAVIQNNELVKVYSSNQHISNLKQKTSRPTTGGFRTNNTVIRRPMSSKPLKGMYETIQEKSINFIAEDQSEHQQVIDELDEFDKKISQNKTTQGFSKITTIENDYLRNTEGFFKIKKLKNRENYPKVFQGNEKQVKILETQKITSYNQRQLKQGANTKSTKPDSQIKQQQEVEEIKEVPINLPSSDDKYTKKFHQTDMIKSESQLQQQSKNQRLNNSDKDIPHVSKKGSYSEHDQIRPIKFKKNLNTEEESHSSTKQPLLSDQEAEIQEI